MDTGFAIVSGDDLAQVAEESAVHARRAMDGLMIVAAKTSDRVENSTAVMGDGVRAVHRQAMDAIHEHVEAALDHASRLAATRRVDEMWRLHHAFLRDRIAASSEQTLAIAKSAGEAAVRVGAHLRANL